MEDKDRLEMVLYSFLAKANSYLEDDEIEIHNEEDTVYMWLALGKFIGIDALFPHMKMVLSSDIHDVKRVVALLASPSKEVIDKASDDRVITDEVIERLLTDLENKPKQ